MTVNMAYDRINSITGAAGAGFRLSLVLNAVKMKMQNADDEIQKISRGISDFSLMLKQVAKTMEEGGVTPTPLAIDTAFDIKDHSERVFEEIKNMTELEQVKDENGMIKDYQLGQRIVWVFKKQKIPYLLGQLDYLKLNLAIMLQILQLAKSIQPNKPRPSDRFWTQERAEVQNMIVLQHWAFEDLKSLYSTASAEIKRDRQGSIGSISEDPPPRYDDPASEKVHLAITPPPLPPKEPDTSQAVVPYQEKPLQQLDESLHQALSRENQALAASVPDIVNHLLHEWTQPEWPNHADHYKSRVLPHGRPARSHQYRPRVSDDDEDDTTESEYSSDSRHKGYYLEGPRTNGARKNVRFKHQQAHVEDFSDEEDHRPRRHTKHHIINSDDDSSDSSISPPKPAQERRHRRDSNTSSNSSRYEPQPRTRRPYTSGPSGPRNSPPEKETIRPGSSRGVPPSPRAVPVPIMHNQPWHPQSPGLRPPPTPGPFPPQHAGPMRRSSGNNPYIPPYMPSPGASPVLPHGQYFPQSYQRQGPPLGGLPSHAVKERPPPRPRNTHGSGGGRHGSDRSEKDKKSASRNIKKGIGIGAGVAGLMELLSGLEGI